jgi:hypothetical protein
MTTTNKLLEQLLRIFEQLDEADFKYNIWLRAEKLAPLVLMATRQPSKLDLSVRV